jgi:curved DNA-binding protein CbpA
VQTLYELLGALPDDDADKLRAAFRDAAKASHPDNNPDDPDAPERFRRVARAYVILRDERQRGTYDSLLAKAEQQQALALRRKNFAPARSLVPDVITGTVIAFVAIGGFLLFERVLEIPNVPAQIQQTSAHAAELTAAMPTTQLSDTIGRAGESNRLDRMPLSDTVKAPDAVKEMGAPTMPLSDAAKAPDAVKEMEAPVAVAAVDNSSTVPAAGNSGTVPAVSGEVKDARYYRQKGQLAYRIGDLALALVDFDLAIDLDPNFSEAYIDRAIVFRRMGDLKHAFADIAQAKRIDDSTPKQTTPLSGGN